MSHPRQLQMVGSGGHYNNNDTTFTKIFVGGLAWETQRDTMRRYFEQFGEILEAVVITDKNTGRSKGYGFVTFKDPDSAMRACQNPSPVIDGRRANCNLASLGANKTRPPTPQYGGGGRFRAGPTGLVATTPAYHASSSSTTFFHQPSGQYTFPYSAYGYSGYSQDTMYPMNYYSVYGGGQQFSPYYPSSGGASGPPPGGLVHNIYPFYAQYAQSTSQQAQAQGYGLHHQYPQHQILHHQYSFLPHQQHYASSSSSSSGILSFPSSMPLLSTTTTAISAVATTVTTTSTTEAAITAGAGSQSSSGTASEQKSST